MTVTGGGIDRELLKPLTDQPFQNLPDIEQVAGILLITAALTPEYEGEVRKAIEGSGRKQFLLGGAEIVLVAVVGLEALRLVLTKGKTSQKRQVVITHEGGKETIKITEEVQFGLSAKLGSILRTAVGLSSQ